MASLSDILIVFEQMGTIYMTARNGLKTAIVVPN